MKYFRKQGWLLKKIVAKWPKYLSAMQKYLRNDKLSIQVYRAKALPQTTLADYSVS